MRKRIITHGQEGGAARDQDWLDLEALAEVEVTSEQPTHPIEAALLPGHNTGWRAAEPGTQTIRLLFAEPQRLRRIQLAFEETQVSRTQEYVLRWSGDSGQPLRDVVRQQWNFSPGGATSQREEHHVDLPAVAVLELTITPDTSGGAARASLAQLRLG